MATNVTARDMLTALYWHFNARWAMLTEVTARPDRRRTPEDRDRRIDALLIRQNPDCTGGFERLAIEVKVSRGDFFSDVRDPSKQAPWRALAHRHAYAVPEGLVRVDEVPVESGLIVVDPSRDPMYPGRVSFARRSPRAAHDPGPMPMANIVDAFWRTSRLEAERKGYASRAALPDDPESLRVEIKRLRHELDLANGREARAAERARDWQRRYAAHEPPPCAACGDPLYPGRGRRAEEWAHRGDEAAAQCEELRMGVARREWNLLPADDWRRKFQPHALPPEPVDRLAESA